MTALFNLLNPATWITEGLIVAVSAIISVEGWALQQLLAAISLIVNWQGVTNNEIVAAAWGIARNMTNLFFIVGLVVISFATIFKVTGVLSGYYYKTALPRLLFAAIFINLSLGLGESVVLISNRVTTIMVGILGNGLSLITTELGTNNLLTSPLVITDTTPASRDIGLNLTSKAPDGSAWDAYLTSSANRTTEEEAAYQKCLKESDPNNNSVTTREGSFARWMKVNVFKSKEVTKSIGTCVQELAKVRRGERDVGFGERLAIETAATTEQATKNLAAISDKGKRFVLLASSVFTALMLVMVIISVLSAVSFFAFRIIAIWILLFTSAFAFGLCWVKEADWLKKWWTMLVGWSSFGPLYLLVLIFGMMFLSRQGELMAAVSAAGGNTGTVSQLLTTMFFHIFAVIVFVGGLKFALDSAFAGAVKSTPIIGQAVASAGAFSATAWSAAFGKRVAYGTGVPALASAAAARAGQAYRDYRPEMLRGRSAEEREAAMKRRFGVRGGGVEEAKLFNDRLGKERSSLESGMKAKNASERKAYLESYMNSSNRAQALAARQMLTERGELSAAEQARTASMMPTGISRAEYAAKQREPKKERIDEITKGYDPTKGAAGVAAAVAGLDDKTKEAALRSIAERDPQAVAEFEIADKKLAGGAASSATTRFYNQALSDPAAFAKLDPSYFDPGPKLNTMKGSVNLLYQQPPASATPEQKQAMVDRREKARGELIRAARGDTKVVAGINSLFS